LTSDPTLRDAGGAAHRGAARIAKGGIAGQAQGRSVVLTGLTRRQWLAGAGAGLSAAATAEAAEPAADKKAFRYMLNTATIMGQKLPVAEEVEIAAKAGYQAIEPWVRELQAHVNAGHSLKDLAKRVTDRGLRVESAIGFAEWLVDDDARRKKGLEQAARDMELVRQVGGTRLAAPPAGATMAGIDPLKAAERYRALLEVGAKVGVVPQVEVWGFSKVLSRLGETAMVAIESGHPRACVLADVYHLHKGGSGFTGVQLLSPAALQVFHMNDYPADPPRDKITDAARVYPGDGVAPLTGLLRDLHRLGFRGLLSLELFNRDYWKQDALLVARTGLAKMKAVVAKALG
jgi:sugar phosphate isomerase/epimerase